MPNANSEGCDHSAHSRSLIRAFAVRRYILQYPLNQSTSDANPDQTVRMRNLIWAFDARVWDNVPFSHMAHYIKTSN